MKLYEEFKLYENMWDSLTEANNQKLLWINPDGIEIDLNDPSAYQKELDTEKTRYQLYLRKRILTDDRLYNNMPPSWQAGRVRLAQKIKKRAEEKGTSFATELEQTIYKHMEWYRGKLKKEKDKLAAQAGAVEEDEKIWYDKKTAFDISTEEGAIAYINRMAINYLGGTTTPERIKAKLEQLKQEVLPKLENLGYTEIAKKISLYIAKQIAILEQGEIPEELVQGAKKPTLFRQVRNKNYDISNKYAFGTYLSYSYRDILKQNPGMSEDEARKTVCDNVIMDLQKEPINPTTTTAIKQLEAIKGSPTAFYNFIHARRLANLKTTEKRRQRRQ